MKKILLSSLLLVSAVNAEETTKAVVATDTNQSVISEKVEIMPSTTRKSGFYAGVGMGLINFGGSVEVDNGYRTTSIDKDTEDKPFSIKVGYLTESENRVELYYKTDSIDTENNLGNARNFDASLFGLNYQWGISSLSSDKLLPYIRLGLGFGSGTADFTTLDLTAVEVDLALGAYYEVAPNIDVSAGIYRRAVVFADDVSDDTIGIALNGIELGATYHF